MKKNKKLTYEVSSGNVFKDINSSEYEEKLKKTDVSKTLEEFLQKEGILLEIKGKAMNAKHTLSVKIPVDLLNRIKNAVYWMPDKTIAKITEEALIAYINQLEEQRGEIFKQREHEIKVGRRVQ